MTGSGHDPEAQEEETTEGQHERASEVPEGRAMSVHQRETQVSPLHPMCTLGHGNEDDEFADDRLGTRSGGTGRRNNGRSARARFRGTGRRSNGSTSESARDTGKSIYPVCTYVPGHHTDKPRRCTETTRSRYAYASNDTLKLLNKLLFQSPTNEDMDEEPPGLSKVSFLCPLTETSRCPIFKHLSLPSLLVAKATS